MMAMAGKGNGNGNKAQPQDGHGNGNETMESCVLTVFVKKGESRSAGSTESRRAGMGGSDCGGGEALGFGGRVGWVMPFPPYSALVTYLGVLGREGALAVDRCRAGVQGSLRFPFPAIASQLGR